MMSLPEYLQKHNVSKENPKPITNTRIADKQNGIYGGSYHIPDDEYDTFLQIYYNHVFVNGNNEYLTEKQRDEGPIVIDLDFRYPYDTDSRKHTEEHILDFIALYLDELKKVYVFGESAKIDIFVFEKPEVNRVENKQITKDGIHIIFGVQADRATQLYIRSRIIEKLPQTWDLPITNTWEDVFDHGIVAGFTNWQLIGSRKPNNKAYALVFAQCYEYDTEDNEFCLASRREQPDKTDIAGLLPRLSIRHKNHPKFPYTAEYTVTMGANPNPTLRRNHSSMTAGAGAGAGAGVGRYLQIKNAEELNNFVGEFIDGLTIQQYEIRETHSYVMVLPESYYGKGSYSKWMRVGWALRNIDDSLFITWVAFSAKSPDFHYTDISTLADHWLKFDMKNPDGLTKRSIIYWAKQDARERFNIVHRESIDYYIDQTLNSMMQNAFAAGADDKKVSGYTDFDLAMVLYQLYKDQYICVSVKNSIWYQYKNHRWQEIDSGTNLRKCISTELRGFYEKKMKELLSRLPTMEEGSEPHKRLQVRISKISDIAMKLGKTMDKKNIMIEAKELFYDAEFLQRIDTNPYLMCYNNGVIDFKTKVFRHGYSDDYISKTTNINYIPLDTERHRVLIDEIHDFMNKLFPIKELCEYMWQHLASTLMGTNANQTFNMYLGAGQNGKSVLVSLMEKVLGEYKGDVPISLICGQRAKIGGLAPELVKLKGVRYACMAEPSKGDAVNEGQLKQITSGMDQIQCRGLYMIEPLSYTPQFKLVVCTNTLMEIKTTDHGTWRRIRIVDFLSLFTDTPVTDDKEKPYQYPMDRNLTEKFDIWKEVFMSMLVEKVYKTGGVVTDCPMVMASSNKYRVEQDYVAEFVSDRIVKIDGGHVNKTELSQEFSVWFKANRGGKAVPNIKEVITYIEKNLAKYDTHRSCWAGIKICYENRYNDDNDLQEEEEEDTATATTMRTETVDEEYGL
jgi:P4 family phage/plasmid primase-like protien